MTDVVPDMEVLSATMEEMKIKYSLEIECEGQRYSWIGINDNGALEEFWYDSEEGPILAPIWSDDVDMWEWADEVLELDGGTK